MNSLKMFHGYVTITFDAFKWQPHYYQSVFMVTLLLSISFCGNLTIINQFLW